MFDVQPLPGTPEITFEDHMPRFFAFWDASEGQPPETLRARFEAEVIAPHRELYEAGVLGEQHLDRTLEPWLSGLADAMPAMRAAHRRFVAEREAAEARFTSACPDFDWHGRVILYPSGAAFVGAARMVDGQPTVLLGLDTAAFEQRELALSLHHELFHMYQVPGGRNIAEALWVEGLATYASLALSPGHDDGDALPASTLGGAPVSLEAIVPDRLPELGPALRSVLRAPTDTGTPYTSFFVRGADVDIPTRTGFWFGLTLVRRMARGRSLQDLAALDPSTLVDDIEANLDAMIRATQPT